MNNMDKKGMRIAIRNYTNCEDIVFCDADNYFVFANIVQDLHERAKRRSPLFYSEKKNQNIIEKRNPNIVENRFLNNVYLRANNIIFTNQQHIVKQLNSLFVFKNIAIRYI